MSVVPIPLPVRLPLPSVSPPSSSSPLTMVPCIFSATSKEKETKADQEKAWSDNINQVLTLLKLTLREQWTWQMTKDNGDNLFVPIAAKWLASGTDDDDDSAEVADHSI